MAMPVLCITFLDDDDNGLDGVRSASRAKHATTAGCRTCRFWAYLGIHTSGSAGPARDIRLAEHQTHDVPEHLTAVIRIGKDALVWQKQLPLSGHNAEGGVGEQAVEAVEAVEALSRFDERILTKPKWRYGGCEKVPSNLKPEVSIVND